MSDTIFSKILRGEIPCHKVYEDDLVLAFLDIGPLSLGHTLVIPKEAVATLGELSDESSAAIGRVLPRLCRALVAVTGVPEYNVLQNNGAGAHQAVFHVHFHIIPRFDSISEGSPGAGLGIRWPAGKLDAAEGKALAAAMVAGDRSFPDRCSDTRLARRCGGLPRSIFSPGVAQTPHRNPAALSRTSQANAAPDGASARAHRRPAVRSRRAAAWPGEAPPRAASRADGPCAALPRGTIAPSFRSCRWLRPRRRAPAPAAVLLSQSLMRAPGSSAATSMPSKQAPRGVGQAAGQPEGQSEPAPGGRISLGHGDVASWSLLGVAGILGDLAHLRGGRAAAGGASGRGAFAFAGPAAGA